MLRRKFLIPCLLALVLAMGFTACISFFTTKKAVKGTVTTQLEQTAALLSVQVNDWMKDRKAEIDGWAAEDSFADALQTGFVAKAKRRLSNTKLSTYIENYVYYTNIVLLDAQGIVISAGDESLVGTSYADKPFLQEALSSGAATTNVFRQHNLPVIGFAVRVEKEQDGAVLQGVLYSEVNLGYLENKTVGTIVVGKTGQAFLFDAANRQISAGSGRTFADVLSHDVKSLPDAGFEEIDRGDGNIYLIAYQKMLDFPWVVSIEVREQELLEDAITSTIFSMGILLIVLILNAVVIAILLEKILIQPLRSLTDFMEMLANKVYMSEVPFLGRNDEIGAMSLTLKEFQKSLLEKDRMEIEQKEMEKQQVEKRRQAMMMLASDFDMRIGKIVEEVSSAAMALQGMASQLSSVVQKTTKQSDAVVFSAQEASTNVSAVAAATEELSRSIQEISKNVSETAEKAAESVTSAEVSQNNLNQLQDAIKEIDTVIQSINEVAEQTNLLALNATIEAARAGDAGKGFAVVASEVKTLAGETHNLTDRVGEIVSHIKNSAAVTFKNVNDILQQITMMSSRTTSVSASVEEQKASTEEISRSIQLASESTGIVSDSIQDIRKASNENMQSTQHLNASSSNLAKQAAELKSAVEDFLKEIRGS